MLSFLNKSLFVESITKNNWRILNIMALYSLLKMLKKFLNSFAISSFFIPSSSKWRFVLVSWYRWGLDYRVACLVLGWRLHSASAWPHSSGCPTNLFRSPWQARPAVVQVSDPWQAYSANNPTPCKKKFGIFGNVTHGSLPWQRA